MEFVKMFTDIFSLRFNVFSVLFGAVVVMLFEDASSEIQTMHRVISKAFALGIFAFALGILALIIWCVLMFKKYKKNIQQTLKLMNNTMMSVSGSHFTEKLNSMLQAITPEHKQDVFKTLIHVIDTLKATYEAAYIGIKPIASCFISNWLKPTVSKLLENASSATKK